MSCDVMLTGFQSGRQAPSAEDVNKYFDEQWFTTVKRRSAQAAGLFEVNRYNVMELFRLHAQLIEIERSAESEDQVRSSTENAVAAFVREIAFSAGAGAVKAFEGTTLAPYDGADAELRDDELGRVAAGKTIDRDADAEALTLTMPPARNRHYAKQLADAKDAAATAAAQKAKEG